MWHKNKLLTYESSWHSSPTWSKRLSAWSRWKQQMKIFHRVPSHISFYTEIISWVAKFTDLTATIKISIWSSAIYIYFFNTHNTSHFLQQNFSTLSYHPILFQTYKLQNIMKERNSSPAMDTNTSWVCKSISLSHNFKTSFFILSEF